MGLEIDKYIAMVKNTKAELNEAEANLSKTEGIGHSHALVTIYGSEKRNCLLRASSTIQFLSLIGCES